MCSFEKKWVKSFGATVLSKVWLQYVVDRFAVFKSKEYTLKFKSDLNSCYESIKFTHELEKVREYIFLTFWLRKKDLNMELLFFEKKVLLVFIQSGTLYFEKIQNQLDKNTNLLIPQDKIKRNICDDAFK